MSLQITNGGRYLTRDGRYIATILGPNGARNATLYPWLAEYRPLSGAAPWTAHVSAEGVYYVGSAPNRFDLVERMPLFAEAERPTATVVAATLAERLGEAPASPTSASPQAAGIGDVTSTAKGSGARYNAGKTALELIPLTVLAESLARASDAYTPTAKALHYLGLFQGRHPSEREALFEAISAVGADDLFAAWAECADVFDFGRKKYAEWNWAKGMPWSVPLACAARHLKSMSEGEALDRDSGKPHRGHFICNVVMLLTYLDTYPEGDDRPTAGMLAKVEA